MTVAPISNSLEDGELVTQLVAGSERAARELVGRHAGPLARLIAAGGALDHEIEDLVQETFVKAFRAARTWRREAPFRAWLFAIARNLARDAARRRIAHVSLDAAAEVVSAGGRADEVLEARDMAARLTAALRRLSPMQRDVFLLRAQQGMPYSEIAVSVGTSQGAARVHYSTAVRRLKEQML